MRVLFCRDTKPLDPAGLLPIPARKLRRTQCRSRARTARAQCCCRTGGRVKAPISRESACTCLSTFARQHPAKHVIHYGGVDCSHTCRFTRSYVAVYDSVCLACTMLGRLPAWALQVLQKMNIRQPLECCRNSHFLRDAHDKSMARDTHTSIGQ